MTELFYMNRKDSSINMDSQNIMLSQLILTNISLIGTERITYPLDGPKITGTQSNPATIFLYSTLLLPAPMVTGVVIYNVYPKNAPNQAIKVPLKGVTTRDLTFVLGLVYNYNLAKYTLNYFDVDDDISNDESVVINVSLNCPLTPLEELSICEAVEGHLNNELFNHESINGIATVIKDRLNELLISL